MGGVRTDGEVPQKVSTGASTRSTVASLPTPMHRRCAAATWGRSWVSNVTYDVLVTLT